MEYKTRMEKRSAIQKQHKKEMRMAVSFVGATLVSTPTVLTISPQQILADEYQMSTNSVDFLIGQIAGSAQEIATANDLYASVMIAQALLESGNGQSLLASAPNYNLFGVKAYDGQSSIWLSTQEYLNGQWVTMNEPFRVYNSYWESMQDHAAVLKSINYTTGQANYGGTWKSQTSSFYDATAYLTGRYATDPSYAQKLNYLIEVYGLTQYDTPSATESYSYQATSSEASETVVAFSGSSTYTVVAGDTLWDIAQNAGISLDQLMANNGLTTDLITIGQQLIV